ncbi:hypothetical protein OHA72_26690 [Dactylosporangium sp. NBC_01737]|nr:hypothetical protein OHA72_26690 [Dactylosporangium sp. NBC_01737]
MIIAKSVWAPRPFPQTRTTGSVLWPIYAVVLRNLPWAPFIWFGIEQAAR